MTPKILLIGGSLNQTTMMHGIAQHLQNCECWFTPFYATGLLGLFSKTNLLKFTILGGSHFQATLNYLESNHLLVDFGGIINEYDAVITCTDLIVQSNIRSKRLILVQEGMTEKEDLLFTLVRYLKFPRFLANTAATGLSDAYDLFCVASHGYRDLFIGKGVKPDKIVVTGIPNFDNATSFLGNDFPYKSFILVATSSIRETGKYDDRLRFLKKVQKIAGDRKLIFKLHPNEKISRARREILSVFPGATVYTDGNINHMIANCDVLISQNSSVIYIALALGKEVHSYFDLAALHKLMPIQNNGRSSQRIAEVSKYVVNIPLNELRHSATQRGFARRIQFSDVV